MVAAITTTIDNTFRHNKSFTKQSISDLTTEVRSTSGDVPPPLIGASTTVLDHHVYVFGGRVASTRQMTNHLYILNLSTLEWVRHIAPPDSAAPPVPRYFHSACTYLDRYIIVFGGMGNLNSTSSKRMGNSNNGNSAEERVCAMDDICIFDIETMCWIDIRIEPSIFTPQARYAHVAVIWDTNKLVIIGGQDLTNQHIHEINIFHLQEKAWIYGGPFQGPHDAYRTIPFCPTIKDNFSLFHARSTAVPFWKPKKEDELPVCIYSNYNFNDIHRDLVSFSPMNSMNTAEWTNHSSEINASILQPPGLRFPTGHLMGDYLIVSGTHLSATQKGFQVWALNLVSLTWSSIDTGNLMMSGSWNRGVLSQQKFYVMGHTLRDLKEDYGYRKTNFDHVAVIDLEAYGVYNPPPKTCSVTAQELGLSLLNDPGLGDVLIWTTDEQHILVNSMIISQRWPGFATLLKRSNNNKHPTAKKQLFFPENYAVTLAFLQYIYTDHLTTAQQYQPQILCRLLILADMYRMKRLEELATFALHQSLTISTASLVYETATLALQGALQVRALKIMISAKRLIESQLQQQQQQHLENHDSNGNNADWISPSNSTTTGSVYSSGEPLSPSASVTSSYSGLRRLANNSLSGISPSTSERSRYVQ